MYETIRTIFLETPASEPTSGRTSKSPGLGKGTSLSLVQESFATMATPPWEKPAFPLGRLRVKMESPLPRRRRSDSFSRLAPSENQVSVIKAKVQDSSWKVLIKLGIFGLREREFVLIKLHWSLFLFKR